MADRWKEKATVVFADLRLIMGDSDCAIETIARALRRAAGEWLPIETAPRDGTPIDVWVQFTRHSQPTAGQRETDIALIDGKWVSGGTGDELEWGPDEYGQRATVTHYHIPAPPEPDHG